MGNPLMEETGGLFALDTQSISHPSVTEMVFHYDNALYERFLYVRKS